MTRALELAQMGMGNVSPNPMVGCVIVHNSGIIGEGWHESYGGPHAEVNAINKVDDKSNLSESTAYISLEPCSFHGKTPPCVELLVKHGVRKVVICNNDPNPKVSGDGINYLKKHGIEVIQDLLASEGRYLNRRFFTNQTMERPFIILKWAQTSDGFLAKINGDSKWISSVMSRRIVHRWRSEEDAIMVGRKTVECDDPLLNVRHWSGTDPVRIILDPQLKLESHYRIFNSSIPTIIYNTRRSDEDKNNEFCRVNGDGFIQEILRNMMEREIGSCLIEGGRDTLNGFIRLNLWDEARVFISPSEFIEGINAPDIGLSADAEEMIGEDKLLLFRNEYPGGFD